MLCRSNSHVYKNVLSSIKRFVRDYLGLEQMVSTFKFPKHTYRPKVILTREEVKRFYESLDTLKEKAIFLMYATSGLRHKELLSLTFSDADFNSRRIMPKKDKQTTKKVWCTFFNTETKTVLMKYLSSRKDNNKRLFPYDHNKFDELWRKGKERTGIRITPQILREFFCQQMGELGVPDRYIDAFCGRVPKTILARHYTDYSPERLKRIYDKARLKVLS
jgi:integrase/recombinase XerD